MSTSFRDNLDAAMPDHELERSPRSGPDADPDLLFIDPNAGRKRDIRNGKWNKQLMIVTALPSEVEPFAKEIARFVDAMVYKLKVHHKKGKWENLSPAQCLELLRGEVAELEEAITGGNMIEGLLESADVGNFALIMSSLLTEKK